MKATLKLEPFPHVLLSEYYTEGEWNSCMEELRKLHPHLLPPEFTGTAVHTSGRPLKYNSGLFLDQAMPRSEIIQFARNHMYQELVEQIDTLWWAQQWKANNVQSWMLSRYADGQYYNVHVDVSQFTMLLWLHTHPKPFTGGDLRFPDYDNYTIPCEDNTGIIFYGPMKHEVPPIKGDGRYTITCFTSCQGTPKPR